MIDDIDDNCYDTMAYVGSLSIVIQCSQRFTRGIYTLEKGSNLPLFRLICPSLSEL